MALASKHLAVSQPDTRTRYYASSRLHSDRGAGCRTFRGFQLAGELFLLTSFFIEPNVHRSTERVRSSLERGAVRYPGESAERCHPPERALSTYIGHLANMSWAPQSTRRQRSPNLNSFGSTNKGKFESSLLRGCTRRWYQMVAGGKKIDEKSFRPIGLGVLLSET
jgi:hypothetical protein